MYRVFYGSDRAAVRDAATNYIDKNFPADGTLTNIEAGSFASGQIVDALGATSLFGGSEWFLLDNPSENPEMLDEVTSGLKELAESKNNFVILENALLAPAKKKYEKYAEELVEFKAEKAEKGESFNAFQLAEALANKDKRKLWVYLQEARLSGMSNEEISGMLWWQLKSLRLAKVTSSASAAGMKDYPYNKAKKSLQYFSDGQLEKLSIGLLELYHADHAGVRKMDTSLEQWVLEMI